VTLSSPAQLMARLEEIREDVARRRPEYERAGDDAKTGKREYEQEMAQARLQAEGTVQERSDRALLEVVKSGAYKRFKVAEGRYEGLRAAHASMEMEAMILMALLKGEKS
jgi:hypothetical protein